MFHYRAVSHVSQHLSLTARSIASYLLTNNLRTLESSNTAVLTPKTSHLFKAPGKQKMVDCKNLGPPHTGDIDNPNLASASLQLWENGSLVVLKLMKLQICWHLPTQKCNFSCLPTSLRSSKPYCTALHVRVPYTSLICPNCLPLPATYKWLKIFHESYCGC